VAANDVDGLLLSPPTIADGGDDNEVVVLGDTSMVLMFRVSLTE